MPNYRSLIVAEEMMSRLLLFTGCVAILLVSIGGEEQNETSTAQDPRVTRLVTPLSRDPSNISPAAADPTSVPSQPNATTLLPSDGAANNSTPPTTEATHAEVTSTEATVPKAGDVPGTNSTQNATTEATRAWVTTGEATTADTTAVGPTNTTETTRAEATTAETTAVGPSNTTEATTAETTAVGPSNTTEATTAETTSVGPTNTTSPVILVGVTTMPNTMEPNSTNVTIVVSPDAMPSNENTTGLNTSVTTAPSELTSGLGANNGTTITMVRNDNPTTLSPNQNNICNLTAYVCLNGGACYADNNRPMCRCQAGWTGTQCESDVDECNSSGMQSEKCDAHANCTNSVGGYNCSCDDAYVGDGFRCTYVNLCDTKPCSNGFCLSAPNYYQCVCPGGWRGSNCTIDVDECMENSHRCWEVRNAVCVNNAGSYSCQCPLGYYGNATVKCTEDLLYPSGVQNVSLRKERNSNMTVDLVGGFPYSGQMHYRMQISSNGYITFGPDALMIPLTWNTELLSNVSIIAPYWSLIDLTDLNDSSIVEVDCYDFWNATLNLTSSRVRSLIVDQTRLYSNESLEPQFAVVVTWKNVVPYPADLYAGWENATFQVVLATDGSQSAVLINYAVDRMLWNPRSDNRTIIIGLTDPDGDTFLNYTSHRYRPDLATNVDKPGRFYFTLAKQQNNSHMPCIAWHQRQNGSLLSSVMEALVPCPCTLQQALNDWRFVNDSQETLCVRRRIMTNSAVQLCCYDSVGQALIVGLGGGYLRMAGDEMDGRKKCCQDSDLCHLFYEKRPANDCRKYIAPPIGAIWGDPHFSSFYGVQFSFNGLGEYILFQSTSGMFQVQGRFERPVIRDAAAGTTTLTNVAALSAVAVKYGDNSAIELKVTNNGLTLYTAGASYPLPLQMTALPGAEAGSSTSSSILIHFKLDAVIQVSVENGFMRLRVQLPKTLLTKNDAMGLLVRQCPAPPNVFLSLTDNLDTFRYFGYCMITKTQSLFFYDLDGSTYELFLNPSFQPLFFSNYNQSTFDTPFCGSSSSCWEDWIKTKDQARAVASKTFEDDLMKSRYKLANFPPMFSSEMLMVLNATVGQEMRLMLYASDPEKQPVQYQVQTQINSTEWQLVDNTFIWKPSQSSFDGYDDTSPFLSFFAMDSSNASSLYWPYVKFCPCSTDVSSNCTFDYPSKLDHQMPKDRLVIGRCQCLAGWTGDLCIRSMDVCSLNPCFPGTTCRSNVTDGQMAYTCGPCPSGLIRDGNQCYDLNECLTAINRGCTNCTNTLGSYMCNCDPGYTLARNKTTCLDIDECSRNSRLCVKDGEFCHNLPGSYECRCHPDYYMANSACIYAPVKYGGKITFKAFNTGTKYMDWMDSLADNKSASFHEVAGKVEALILQPYVLVTGFVGAKVTQLQKGSIQVNYDLYFRPESSVNSSYLDELMRRFMEGYNCEMNGPDCRMAELVGVNTNQSNVYDKDLCLSPLDNACDSQTMDCRTENGRALCSCKAGYQRVSENVEACEDLNECAPEENSCNMNMSLCMNTVGSYFCSCVSGFYMNNGSCSDVCDPNPCMNDGGCSPRGDEFACTCVGIWAGFNCTDENPEAVKLRKVAIGIGVGLGILCLILIVGLIVCCVRQRHTSSSYQCATTSNTRGNYAGRKSVNIHNWDPEEMEFQTNGNRMASLDREAQPQSKTFTGNENPAYSDLNLERDQRHDTAPKKSSDYF